jgi:hypothetical protein
MNGIATDNFDLSIPTEAVRRGTHLGVEGNTDDQMTTPPSLSVLQIIRIVSSVSRIVHFLESFSILCIIPSIVRSRQVISPR